MNCRHKTVYNLLMHFLSSILILASLAYGASIEAIKLPEGQTLKLESYQIDNLVYLNSADLSRLLDGVESIDFFGKKGKIEFENTSLEYSLFSSYVKSGENVYNIYRPVQFRDGSFLLPVRYLVDILNRISSKDYSWDGKRLTVSPPVFNVTGMNVFQKLNGLLIEIYLKQPLRFDVVKTDDNWVIITIAGARIDSLAFSRPLSVKAVYEVRTYQFEHSGQVSLRLRPRDFTFTSKTQENPQRIQVLIRGEGFAQPSSPKEDSSEDGNSPATIDVIVIDPGHGGQDDGAVGSQNEKEKDIVLSISRHLYNLLKEDGRFKPVLTRQDDVFVPLRERTALANSIGADMFISIHVNASDNADARGAIVFSLAEAKTDRARAAAILENSSIRFENLKHQERYLTDLEFTLRDMVQSEFQRESADLADMIQREIGKTAGIQSRGVDQAGFFVLDKAYMPAVLVETGFISNGSDEKLLTNDRFQRKVALAIYKSIVSFKMRYEQQQAPE